MTTENTATAQTAQQKPGIGERVLNGIDWILNGVSKAAEKAKEKMEEAREDNRGFGQVLSDGIFGKTKAETGGRVLMAVGLFDTTRGVLVPGSGTFTRGLIEAGAGAAVIIGRRVYVAVKARRDAKATEEGTTPSPTPTDAQTNAAVRKAYPSENVPVVDKTAEVEALMQELYVEANGAALGGEKNAENAFSQLKHKVSQPSPKNADLNAWRSLQASACRILGITLVDAK